jgi:hypothetical protein
MPFITLTYWILVSCLVGYIEAHYWHYLDERYPNPHESGALIKIRALLFFPVAIQAVYMGWQGIPYAFGCAAVFVYFHAGTMYSCRHKLNPRIYEKRWKADPSDTSTAAINFTYHQRVMLLAVGIALLIASAIWTLL